MEALADPNNNQPGENKAYSLRPRALTRRDSEPESHAEEADWRPRGRSKRRSTPKQKSAPLSKYRRKTANARERSRMREINEAFEALRRALPCLAPSDDGPEKTTKIMTLRMAMKYIGALDAALRRADDSDADSLASEPSELSLTPSSLSEQSELDQLLGLPDPVLAPFLGDLKPPVDRLRPQRTQQTPRAPAAAAGGLPPFGLLTTAASAPTPPPEYNAPWRELREFDCLPPSPMNLDELFLT